MGVKERAERSQMFLDAKRIPVTLEWNNINYSLPVKDPDGGCCSNKKIQKEILKGMSGTARPGQLIAIMGPSGSGKTTLLNVLAGRVMDTKGCILTGEIKINGVNRNELGSKFARIAAFVQQDDVLFSLQTVRETLLTAARFRLPKETSMDEKNKRVDAIISELGLAKAEHTHIGDAKIRGVSGGERKRANIGVELIQDPSLLFLDEPTSGLDSFQALNVVETLKLLCQSGTTVVLSIHQPRSSIFALFDQIIILSEGSVVYDGEPGKTSVDYFTTLGFPCPDLFNPADYFLDVVSIDNRSPEEEEKSRQRIELLTNKWKKYSKRKGKDYNDDESSSEALNKFEDVKTVRSGICTQIAVLGARNFRQLSRDKFSLIIRLFMTCFFALFLSALYSETDNGQKSIQDRTGILFFVCINQSFGGIFNTINTFVVEKAIVMRERQAKSYYLSSYYITKVLTAMPIDIITPLLFACIIYWIVGLNPDPFAFFMFCIITIAVSLAAIGLGFCVGSIAPTIDAASAMAPTIMVLMILFGGFYINTDNIPDWIEWLSNVSTIQWSFAAFAINEFSGLELSCHDVDVEQGEQCTEDGDDVIKLLSFEKYTLGECVGYLFILMGVFHAISFLVLRFNKPKYLDVSPGNWIVDHNDDDDQSEQISSNRTNTLDPPDVNIQLMSNSEDVEEEEEQDNNEQP